MPDTWLAETPTLRLLPQTGHPRNRLPSSRLTVRQCIQDIAISPVRASPRLNRISTSWGDSGVRQNQLCGLRQRLLRGQRQVLRGGLRAATIQRAPASLVHAWGMAMSASTSSRHRGRNDRVLGACGGLITDRAHRSNRGPVETGAVPEAPPPFVGEERPISFSVPPSRAQALQTRNGRHPSASPMPF